MTRPSSATPAAPHTTSTARLPSTRPNGSGRQRGSCSRGVAHSTASATNETHSTTVAATANITSGIGRFWRCVRPLWANAGATSAAASSTVARRMVRKRVCLQRGLQRVLERRHSERPFETRRDLPVLIKDEEPRFRAQVERLQRRPQAGVHIVVLVDLLVD